MMKRSSDDERSVAHCSAPVASPGKVGESDGVGQPNAGDIVQLGVEEVDEEGGYRPQPRLDRVAEAVSLRYLLFRDQRNEPCKVYHKSVFLRKLNRKRHTVEPLGRVGEVITMGHVNASSVIHNGLSAEKELLVISDLAIRCKGA